MITVQSVELDDPRARSLWDEQQDELAARYGEPDLEFDFADHMAPGDLIGSYLALDAGGEPIGTGLVRWSPYDTGAGAVEVKRLYVRPAHRGHGHSRVIMGVLEQAALRAGAVRIVLETGVEQPEALVLYERIGYSRFPGYGEYKDDPRSVCFSKELPTRVLVVNGSIGAGKTSVAESAYDALADRGARAAMIDGDFLCQARPTQTDDPFNQELLFANLAAVAPVYRTAGFGYVVVARVVEDAEDRARYAQAFAVPSPAGGALPAQVVIGRVTAPEPARKDRIVHRDLDPAWHQWGHARTVELEANLVALQLDDVVVTNADRSPRETADELLERVGW
jgi:GNAT superfamily N-acetyltransferase